MIEARALTLQAGSRMLLSRVDFRIERGAFVAILGANGAGKTTLVRTIAGLRRPDSGRLLVNEHDAFSLPPYERGRSMAHIAGDETFLDQVLVSEVVAMGRYPHHRWWEWSQTEHDEHAIHDALDQAGMRAFAHRRFDTLSSGERQRVWIALALAQEAPLLLLDEPTSHLDVRAAYDVLLLLRKQRDAGKTIVCVLHDVNDAAQFADRLLVIGRQRILAYDKPENVLRSAALESAYGIPMEIARAASGSLRVFPAAGLRPRRENEQHERLEHAD
jgi:ABC-type cobalamin/Fe3+-siderophores transport system ATPase subunit